MHFAVDAHTIGRRLTGNEVYIRNLLEGFAAVDSGVCITAYYSVPEAVERIPPGFRKRRVSANPFLRLGADLSWKLRADRPDLVHVQYTAPIACPTPIVVSVHDVSFLDRPDFFAPPRAWQLAFTVERTVRRAVRVLTVSEYSQRCIMRAYGLDQSKVRVVPNGVSPMFRPAPRQSALERLRMRFHLPDKFLLCVGDLLPRKNQIGLIAAFRELLGTVPGLPHHLVFAGKDTWFGPRVREAARANGTAERIHFLGFVTDDELIDLYNGCEVFVFPSFYEGFGLPILEAMACGCPVACSNTTAMPEVADATAILFDPNSLAEMTLALRDLVVDGELRTRMERLGLQRASQFSWSNAARRTLGVYHEVTGEPRRLQARAASVGRP